MKIKIFKGRINLNGDFDNVENKVNAFIAGKNIIDIKQSLSPSEKDSDTTHHFLIITVMYE